MRRLICALLALAICLNLVGSLSESDRPTVRARLEELGYIAPGEEETETGMEGALINFQRANGLSATGTADPDTLEKLYSPKAVTRDEYLEKCLQGGVSDISLKMGDKGKNVKKLQQELAALGYYTGEQSGAFDTDTACAVVFFEIVNGLELTAAADGEMISRLTSPLAIPADQFAGKKELVYGDTGALVKRMQMELKRLGFFSGECSGTFGRKTQEAVNDFEARNGLPVTGVWTVDHTVMCLAGQASDKGSCLKKEESVTLSPGDSGYLVREAKTALYELGFLTAAPDENYDDKTVRAVKLFQEANGLQPTGVADPATRLLLSFGQSVNMTQFTRRMETCGLEAGSESYGVYLLTLRLAALGYPIEPGWLYDDAVTAQVTVFQTAEGIEATGKADSETRRRMNASSAMKYTQAREIAQYVSAVNAVEQRTSEFFSAVRAAVGKPYEAGMTGPDSFGVGGLAYSCYALMGAELAPTASMQLDSAEKLPSFSLDPAQVREGDEVFFRAGEQLYCGIFTREGMLVYASIEEGRVVICRLDELLLNADFAGKVSWFDVPSV